MPKITSHFPGKKVLLVEDYLINQEIVQDMLELMDCEVDTVDNGEEAFQQYQESEYDLILMDIQLPGKDGYQVTQEIRREEQKSGKKSCIVALTANAMEGDREKCIAAGMDDYMSKPIEINLLEQMLQKYLSG